MNIFISYAMSDKPAAETIRSKLAEKGHKIGPDTLNIKVGVNVSSKVFEEVRSADAIIVLVSKNSLRREFVMLEFSALALGDLSNKERRIIPILLDKVSPPSYISSYEYLDFSTDFQVGLAQLVELLPLSKDADFSSKRKYLKKNEAPFQAHIEHLSRELRSGRLTLVCGAGVSIEANVPSWDELLTKLLESMTNRLSEDKSSPIDFSGTSGRNLQAHFRSLSPIIVGKYLKINLGKDFHKELKAALYSKNPTDSPLIRAIVNLARPRRNITSLNSIISFNFDSLIEENLDKFGIKHRAIYSEAIKHRIHELPIYHVHGYLPRKNKIIPQKMEVVFSEDAYHSQFMEPFSWSNLIQLNKLGQSTCLFVGLSLTDPNMRRLLDVSKRKNPDQTLNHFIIKRAPKPSNKISEINDLARLLEERDANKLGLNMIWVDNYKEIPRILNDISII